MFCRNEVFRLVPYGRSCKCPCRIAARLVRLLYLGGLRISEACGLRGRDLASRDDTGQVTVFGKGGKTRAVLLNSPQNPTGAVVDYAACVASDIASTPSTAYSQAAHTQFPLGTTTVTCTATDGAGLTASATFTVTGHITGSGNTQLQVVIIDGTTILGSSTFYDVGATSKTLPEFPQLWARMLADLESSV